LDRAENARSCLSKYEFELRQTVSLMDGAEKTKFRAQLENQVRLAATPWTNEAQWLQKRRELFQEIGRRVARGMLNDNDGSAASNLHQKEKPR
jgi:hypothetical protein